MRGRSKGEYEFGVRVGHGARCQLCGRPWWRVGNDIGGAGLVEESFGPENGRSQWQDTGLAISRARRKEGDRRTCDKLDRISDLRSP